MRSGSASGPRLRGDDVRRRGYDGSQSQVAPHLTLHALRALHGSSFKQPDRTPVLSRGHPPHQLPANNFISRKFRVHFAAGFYTVSARTPRPSVLQHPPHALINGVWSQCFDIGMFLGKGKKIKLY